MVETNQNNIKSHLRKKIIRFLQGSINQDYDCYIKVTLAISISLFCLHIPYNNYLAKVICFIGPLTFSVFLIHRHPFFFANIIKKMFKKENPDLSLHSALLLILFKTFKIFSFCIFIDYIKNNIFTILRVRKFCNFLENLAFKLVE